MTTDSNGNRHDPEGRFNGRARNSSDVRLAVVEVDRDGTVTGYRPTRALRAVPGERDQGGRDERLVTDIVVLSTEVDPSVTIGHNVVIEQDVFVDADTIIGNNVRICSGADIGQRSIIRHNVIVGHQVIIGDNVKIEDNVRIGDGATIPSGSIVPAGTIVLQGTRWQNPPDDVSQPFVPLHADRHLRSVHPSTHRIIRSTGPIAYISDPHL